MFHGPQVTLRAQGHVYLERQPGSRRSPADPLVGAVSDLQQRGARGRERERYGERGNRESAAPLCVLARPPRPEYTATACQISVFAGWRRSPIPRGPSEANE